MKIAVLGRGNVGGGLAGLWERAGHEVTRIGREGGDVSDVEAVVVAVPGGAITEPSTTCRALRGRRPSTRLISGVWSLQRASRRTPNS